MVEIYRAEGVETDARTFQEVELQARLVLHDRVEEGNTGTEPELWQEYFVALFTGCGVPPSGLERVSERVREAHAESHLWTHTAPRTAEVMMQLAKAGYRIGVISNADGRMEGALERAGVRPYIEFVIDSATVGVEKPAPEIFRAGCEALDMPPDSCLYVGDLYPVDYLGATAAGLEAVLLDPLGVHSARASTVSDLEALPAWLEARRA